MRASASFIRPSDTTAYASGDLVANNTTAGSVLPLAFAIGEAGQQLIRRAKISKSDASLTNASFRLHLYRNSPTCTNGDNGAWLTTKLGYVGAMDVTVDKAFSDGAVGVGAPLAGTDMCVDVGTSRFLYGLLEARSGYTPVSAEQFDVTLEIVLG